MPGRGLNPPAGWLVPARDDAGVGSLMSTRDGGVSEAPYTSMNLGIAVGDAPERVAANRARFADACGARPVFLRQVHGTRVVRIGSADAAPDAAVQEADASLTTDAGIACTVLVADCLPVLFAAPSGRGVAAAHAGWRGLAGGVLEASVAALCSAARCEPAELRAWLGACIGPDAFEVGPDVLRAFGADPGAVDSDAFKPHRPGKWLADLPLLARRRLIAAGLDRIEGGTWCTVGEVDRFFSYRRDGTTGRMAASIWLEPTHSV